MVSVVWSVVIPATPPTRRISRNSAQRSRTSRRRTRLRPDRMYQPSTDAVSALVSTMATPPPAMPRAGNGPRPKIRHGDSGTSSSTLVQIAAAGTNMLPVPRITLASAFSSHTSAVPANTTFE
jgi:hypothetical protein